MAQETIRELVIKYGFDIDTDPLEKLDGAMDALKGGLLGIGASLGAAAAGLFGVVHTAAEAGDQMLKMSQRVGVGLEALQVLSFQAKLADVSTEQLGQSLIFLNRNMVEAANKGGEAMAAFRKVGISQAELKSGALSADKVMERVGKTFAKLPDGPNKTALAVEFFGRAGAAMIPLLNEMSAGLTDTQKAVLAMNMVTEEQAKLGQEFNDNLTVMRSAMAGIVKTVGMGLLPVMNDLVQSFTAFIVENKELIKTNLKDFVQGLGDFLKTAGKWALIAGRNIAALARIMGGAGNMVKILLTAMFALSGLSILRGIGMIVQATWGFVTALTAAKAAAFAIPILIGAAIALVILIIDDLVAFFQGRDSVTAIMIEKFKEVWAWFAEAFPNLAKYVKGLFDFWIAYINLLISVWMALFSIIGKVAGFLAKVFTPVLSYIGDRIAVMLSDLGKFAGFIGKGLGFAGEALTKVSQVINPSNPTLPGVSNQSSNTAVSVDAPIQVNVPAGTDAGSVGPYVREGIANGVDSALRQTSRSTIAGVAY